MVIPYRRIGTSYRLKRGVQRFGLLLPGQLAVTISQDRVKIGSANFSKPATGSRRIHIVAVNATTAANGAKDSERGATLVLNASGNFQFLVIKTATLLCDEVRTFS